MKTVCSMLAVVALAMAGAACAGTVQVTVTDKEGKPVADVVVLLDATRRTTLRPADEPVVILQEGLRFVPFLTVVPAGTTLRFVNRDEYDHHVRSVPSGPLGAVAPVVSFEFRLAAAAPKKPAASMGEVVVNTSGPIGLGCHIHSSMRGQVYVAATPWYAKTNAQGVAVIDGVPDGAAELRLWHSDQLQDQAVVSLTVTSAGLKSDAVLNFTPRRRRS